MANPLQDKATDSQQKGANVYSDAPSTMGGASYNSGITDPPLDKSKIYYGDPFMDTQDNTNSKNEQKTDTHQNTSEVNLDAEVDSNSNDDVVNDDVEDVIVEVEDESVPVESDDSEWKDKYMRLHAEWDTYRRRQKEQVQLQKALAAEKLVNNLIPVIDDLERSIDYAQKNGETGLLGGVEAVLTKFVDTLQKDGVEVINPAGEAFDALEAQAVATVDDASVPNETVAEVYQKGYKLANKVLRPAMVTITTGAQSAKKKNKTNKVTPG